MKNLILPTLVTVFLIGAMAYQAQTPQPVLADPPDVKLTEISGYTSEILEPSEEELAWLPKDTAFDKRVYRAENGTWFQVSMVIGGASKSSVHRPELCLPSQGFLMQNPHSFSVNGRPWRYIRLSRGDSGHNAIGFAYTFFNQKGYRTSSHTARIFRDVWDRSILNRIDRWVMVTVNAYTTDEALLSAFLTTLQESIK